MPAKTDETVASLLSSETRQQATSTLVTDLYGLLKQSAVKEFKKWRISGGARALHQNLRRYGMVKTILNMDSPRAISSFYYPTQLAIEDHDGVIHAVSVPDIDRIPIRGNALIVGYVGQGKSIFMRYLAMREIARGRGAIPLFVEMRNIRDRSVISFLLEELATLRLAMNAKLFDYFATQGRFVFF